MFGVLAREVLSREQVGKRVRYRNIQRKRCRRKIPVVGIESRNVHGIHLETKSPPEAGGQSMIGC
jgi:hypothetical protein